MIPKTSDTTKVQRWFEKVIARRANNQMTDRLFGKFKKQYDDFMNRGRSK